MASTTHTTDTGITIKQLRKELLIFTSTPTKIIPEKSLTVLTESQMSDP